MSSVFTLPRRDGLLAAPQAAPAAVEFHYTQTDSFVALLHQLGASLLVSTYQANKLLVVRAAGGGLSTLVRTFDRPMGLAADGRRLALGTRTEVWLLRNAPDIAPRIEPAGQHDACYLPRSCHVTGDIGIHEMAWGGLRSARVAPGPILVEAPVSWPGFSPFLVLVRKTKYSLLDRAVAPLAGRDRTTAHVG